MREKCHMFGRLIQSYAILFFFGIMVGGSVLGGYLLLTDPGHVILHKTLRQAQITTRSITGFYSQFTTQSNKAIQLPVRHYAHAGNWDAYVTEEDGHHVTENKDIPIEKIAVLLIDVWQEHPNDGWLERAQVNIKEKIVPLVTSLREYDVTIIHAPHNEPIASAVTPIEGEFILNPAVRYDKKELHAFLKKEGITTILYAGYATNMCILNRNVSMMRMDELGYNTILVRDATIGIETAESLEGEWAHKMAVAFVESNFEGTTTVEGIQNALMQLK